MGYSNPKQISSGGLISGFFFRIRGVWIPGVLLAVLLLPASFPLSAGSLPPSIALVVSGNIRPYVEAAEGFLAAMDENSDAQISTFFIENNSVKSKTVLKEKIEGRGYSLVVAIGPEATRLSHEALKDPSAPILYSMVLNPEKILEPGAKDCGVPLNIPVSVQLEEITSHLPKLKRIGLLFDPENNENFYRKAHETASALGVEIVPLRASSRSEIPEALRKWQTLDALWMIPDRTIISESIVGYIIKEMILRKVPTIGYNRFFYDSGATLAFVFDYNALGRQTAGLALSSLSGSPCPYAPPVFSTQVNHRVLERLDRNPDAGKSAGS